MRLRSPVIPTGVCVCSARVGNQVSASQVVSPSSLPALSSGHLHQCKNSPAYWLVDRLLSCQQLTVNLGQSDYPGLYQSGANWLNLKSRLVSSATNTMLAVTSLWWQSFIRSPWPRSLEPSREQWFLQLVVCFGRHSFVVFQKRSFISERDSHE